MEDVIKLVTSNEFGLQRQKEIMECIRAFKIDHRHMGTIKKIFIESDLDANGNTTIGQVTEIIQKFNMSFPTAIYNFFMNILQVDDVFDANSHQSFVW